MSTTLHLSSFRSVITLLLATLLTTLIGCNDDDTAANPNIEYTESYKVEYVPGTMDPMQGKTQFQISLTDLSSSLPAEGVAVTLMPLMYMADKTHSTPVDGACLEDASGVYDCTVFYVMADTMGGMSIGHWELKVMLGGMDGESVIFSPSVGMAMGGTAMAKLKHENATMTMMEVTSVRTFQIFKSSLTGSTGNHTFKLFTSTMESMDSIFPAVYTGVTLNEGTMNALPIVSMSIRVSTDPTFMSDVSIASSSDNGYWTAVAITGLEDGVEGTLYIEMTINDDVFNNSIDGVATEGVNDYATFTITPSAPMVM